MPTHRGGDFDSNNIRDFNRLHEERTNPSIHPLKIYDGFTKNTFVF